MNGNAGLDFIKSLIEKRHLWFAVLAAAMAVRAGAVFAEPVKTTGAECGALKYDKPFVSERICLCSLQDSRIPSQKKLTAKRN